MNAPMLRAVRGATTLDADTPEQMNERVSELLENLLASNEIAPENIVSVLLTATDDIYSAFPATAARQFGLEDVPLLGAQELSVANATPLCVRVMLHFYTDKSPKDIQHIYLHAAKSLRPDLQPD